MSSQMAQTFIQNKRILFLEFMLSCFSCEIIEQLSQMLGCLLKKDKKCLELFTRNDSLASPR